MENTMSDTYKTKNYAKAVKARNEDKDSYGISTFWDYHRFRSYKTPRGDNLSKFIIQTVGHRRRRAEERRVSGLVVRNDGYWERDSEADCDCFFCWGIDIHDTQDYERNLPKNAKRHSNVWDYY